MGAVAPGVTEGGDQTGQGDLCRVVVPPAVVAAEPVAPREHLREGGSPVFRSARSCGGRWRRAVGGRR